MNLDALLPQVSDEALFWLGITSVASIFLSIAGVAWFIARMPPDYFTHEHRESVPELYRWPLLRYLVIVLKNLIGVVLILFGLILIFTPGQGALTILIGLMLLNFPGKYRLERWFVTRRGVMHGLNWARAKLGKEPLEAPQEI